MTTNTAVTPARTQPPATSRQVPDTSLPQLRVRVGSPTSLLAVIPGLLRFDPGHSIVVIGTEPGSGQVQVTLRYDVPDPGHPALSATLAKHAVSLLGAQGVRTAVAVGYGTDAEVAPVMAALRERAAEAGIALTELLRAEHQRYWSYVCADPECCPPEGTPFDVTRHPAARALRAAGGRVLAGRAELAATVAAKGGRPGAVVRRATRETLAQLARCLSRLERAGLGVCAPRLTAALGQVAVADAIRRYRAGTSVPVEHAALLTVALGQLRVRDDAWARMEPEYRDAHLRLWTDLTRLARPGYVAAPASLLAFVAWQSGNGALANVALDRALDDDSRYSMAQLLRDALDAGAPPSLARLPMTPEEVAAAYDAADVAEAAALAAGEVGRE
jgi:type III secretion system FlhB-like substrate exporter